MSSVISSPLASMSHRSYQPVILRPGIEESSPSSVVGQSRRPDQLSRESKSLTMIDVAEEEVPERCDGIRSLSLRKERVESHEGLYGEVNGVDDLFGSENRMMEEREEREGSVSSNEFPGADPDAEELR